jgi:MSHA biogenesis protein MshI
VFERGVRVLSRFRKTTKTNARAGIVLADGAFALALVSRAADSKPSIDHCAVHSGDLAPVLKATLDRLGATRASACAVVDGDDYQVVQVEAPDVLPSEMRAAIRWRLRDAVNFNVDEAAVDVFETPDPVRRTTAKMLFAVAARDSAIQRLAGALKPVAKGFHAIDIPELCLRNLSALLPQDSKGVAMLALNQGFAQLVITRQGVMYLTRRIDTARGFNPHERDRKVDIDASALALELQRSLDYYESHYDQMPIGDLVIAPADERARRLASELKNETSLRVSVLDVRDLFIVHQSGDVVNDWPSLMALGAALRVDSEGG